jgi:thioredoxin-like negative regulator of GroEL
LKTIYNLEELQQFTDGSTISVIYFSNEACNVCKVLKPRIIEMLNMQFPKAAFAYVDIEKSPVISGQYRVFTIPTIDIYVEGREHARFSRNVTMHDFEAAVRKPYDMLFAE